MTDLFQNLPLSNNLAAGTGQILFLAGKFWPVADHCLETECGNSSFIIQPLGGGNSTLLCSSAYRGRLLLFFLLLNCHNKQFSPYKACFVYLFTRETMFVNSTCECTNLYLCPDMFLTLSLHHVSDDPEERHHRLWKTGVNAGDREGPCDYKQSAGTGEKSHTVNC